MANPKKYKKTTPSKSADDGASRSSQEPSNEASVSRPIAIQHMAAQANVNINSQGTNAKRSKVSNTVQTRSANGPEGPLKFQQLPILILNLIFRAVNPDLSTIVPFHKLCRNINDTMEALFESKGKLILATFDGSGPFANHDGHLFMAPDLEAYKLNRSKDIGNYFSVDCSNLSASYCAKYAELFDHVTELTICYDSDRNRFEPLLRNFLTARLTKFSFIMARTDDCRIRLSLSHLYRLLNELVTPVRMPELRELHIWITGQTSNELHCTPRRGIDLNLDAIIPQLAKLTLNCYCSNKVSVLGQSNASNLTQLTLDSRFVLIDHWSLFRDSQRDRFIHRSLNNNVTHLRLTQVRVDTLTTLLNLFPNVTSLHLSRDREESLYPSRSTSYRSILEVLVKYGRITELRLDSFEIERIVGRSLPSVKKLILCNKSILDPARSENQVHFHFDIDAFAEILNLSFPNIEELTIFCAEAGRLSSAENQLRIYYDIIRPLKKITLDLSAPEFQFVEEKWSPF